MPSICVQMQELMLSCGVDAETSKWWGWGWGGGELVCTVVLTNPLPCSTISHHPPCLWCMCWGSVACMWPIQVEVHGTRQRGVKMSVTDTAILGQQAAGRLLARPGVCTSPTATNANTTSSARHTAPHYHKGTGGKGRCALRSCTQSFKPTARMRRAELAVFARPAAA
jgi:hypothetical protein